MTDQHRATPEQWEAIKWRSTQDDFEGCSVLLELRARVEALEAGQRPTAAMPALSTRLTPEDLGDYAYSDPIANRALKAGMTQAELIHHLLADRAELLKQLFDAKVREGPGPIEVGGKAYVYKGPAPAPADSLVERVMIAGGMGALRELPYRVDAETGQLVAIEGVETIQDASQGVLAVLSEAYGRGVPSLSRGDLVNEITTRYRLAPKTVDNTLQRMVRATKAEICRLNRPRGHYKLAPRVSATLPIKVPPNGEGQGGNVVSDCDLSSTRGVGTRYSEGTQRLPTSTRVPNPGYWQDASAGYGSALVPTHDREIPIGEGLSALPPWAVQAVAIRDEDPDQLTFHIANDLMARHGITTDGRQVASVLKAWDAGQRP